MAISTEIVGKTFGPFVRDYTFKDLEICALGCGAGWDGRVGLVEEAVADLPNVRVISFEGLLVDCVHQLDAHVVVKGLRAITDFEYEFQMTALNYELSHDLETFFIMSPPKFMYLSSSIIREMASMGGSVAGFVPPCVETALREYFADAYQKGEGE